MRLAVGGWRLAVGGWRLAVGGWVAPPDRAENGVMWIPITSHCCTFTPKQARFLTDVASARPHR